MFLSLLEKLCSDPPGRHQNQLLVLQRSFVLHKMKKKKAASISCITTQKERKKKKKRNNTAKASKLYSSQFCPQNNKISNKAHTCLSSKFPKFATRFFCVGDVSGPFCCLIASHNKCCALSPCTECGAEVG